MADFRSKAPIYRQYDHMVGLQTLVGPEQGSAAVLRLLDQQQWIAATVDSNSRFCAIDPYQGVRHLVFEAARNLACVGATPLGLTNGLNFGSPDVPEVFESLAQTLEGLASACVDMEIPVTGGNVSLYNQTGTQAIPATPVIGMVGALPPLQQAPRRGFPRAGLAVYVLGQGPHSLAGSAWAEIVSASQCRGPLAVIDVNLERSLGQVLPQMWQEQTLASAHNINQGGLAVALAEACLQRDVGVEVTGHHDTNFWFGEGGGRVLVSLDPKHEARALALWDQQRIAALRLGTTGGEALVLGNGRPLPLPQLQLAH